MFSKFLRDLIKKYQIEHLTFMENEMITGSLRYPQILITINYLHLVYIPL